MPSYQCFKKKSISDIFKGAVVIDTKEINFIFKNEKHYRNIVNYYFLEEHKEVSEVKSNTFGNSKEYNFIKKIENREYLKAKAITNALDNMQLSEIEKRIYNLRYKQNLTVEYIAFNIGYSVASINLYLKKIRNKFKAVYSPPIL